MPGLILSAPASGSGKTTVTLGLLRAMSRQGIATRGAKSGPDYIDPQFHQAACGAPCLTLDAWAMGADRLATLAAGPGLLLVEGAMGLFDGAPPDGRGSTAHLARTLNLPVILIVDAAKMAGSVAPLVAGFARHDPDVRIAGVILNRVGSARHEAMLRRALTQLGLPVLGALHRDPDLTQPSRHLGLVQATERPDLDAFLDRVADAVTQQVDLTALTALAMPLPPPGRARARPPAQRIAIAQDAAFAFAYPHLLADWRAAGAEVSPFSPLADQPAPPADLIYLPGGYPELHAATLSNAKLFIQSLNNRPQHTQIYGECGGYMTLGDGLTDAAGTRHPMAGLLRLETSFAARKLHLGYRRVTATAGPFRGTHTAHEFHYATTLNASGAPLFTALDAEGNTLPAMGLRDGPISGSFAHLIDPLVEAPPQA
jgi:cobyrinic acid a,c-diamide synthase